MGRHPFDQPQPSLWEKTSAEPFTHLCFADEIDIDFPSVSHLVARERDTFLGERARDILTTEVSLSPYEAIVGAMVPLDVPVHGTCSRCGGRGETWTESCVACCGTGNVLVHRPVRFAAPPGVTDGTRFRFRLRSPDASSVTVEVRVAIRSSVV